MFADGTESGHNNHIVQWMLFVFFPSRLTGRTTTIVTRFNHPLLFSRMQ